MNFETVFMAPDPHAPQKAHEAHLIAMIENLYAMHGQIVVSENDARKIENKMGKEWFDKHCFINKPLPLSGATDGNSNG